MFAFYVFILSSVLPNHHLRQLIRICVRFSFAHYPQGRKRGSVFPCKKVTTYVQMSEMHRIHSQKNSRRQRVWAKKHGRVPIRLYENLGVGRRCASLQEVLKAQSVSAACWYRLPIPPSPAFKRATRAALNSWKKMQRLLDI